MRRELRNGSARDAGRSEDADDALAYLHRDPNTEAVEAARARCVTALRR